MADGPDTAPERHPVGKSETTVRRRTRASERAQAQLVQAEKMVAMGKLAAGVAHEINNPAGVLLMKLKFLLSIAGPEGLSERAVSTLTVAVEQTERIERIIERLLDFSRPTEGTLRRVDVNQIVSLALQRAQEGRQGPRPELVWQPGADLPAVEADPNELEQVLIHLVDNAVHAAGSEGHVTIRTGTTEDEVMLQVADDGPGIPDDFRDRIFDPFFSTRPSGEGTGLGLAVSSGIVQKFGGSIEVDTTRRKGTTMTVRLPAASPAT